jgi:hypothetical protein
MTRGLWTRHNVHRLGGGEVTHLPDHLKSMLKSSSGEVFSWMPEPKAYDRRLQPIICGMDYPDRVIRGVMVCGDCGKPLKLGAGGVSACKNPECGRNKPESSRSEK